MQKERFSRQVVIVFALVLVVYLGVFSCDQHVRQRKGPWQVTFFETNGAPTILVNQPYLGITNVQILFAGEQVTNQPAAEVLLSRPGQSVPFGSIKFEDLTYLPGSVTFDLFGHEVELLPRTLYLNKEEVPWESNALLVLNPGDKLPAEAPAESAPNDRVPDQASTNSRPSASR